MKFNLLLNRFLLHSFLALCCIQAIAQEVKDISHLHSTEWKGFTRMNFTFEGKKAWILKPHKSISGNPWLWRARFPSYHSEADSILASEGFHIAYINTGGMFANAKAMEIWDGFYDHLIQTYGLSKKVSLSGVSRGGLFIYTWAKRHPQKVNCIYGDAPVCDIKSWPGGFGDGMGSPNDWKQLKDQHGFATDEEAKVYANNPMDNLEILAAEKIPILHMIGLKDKIVPAHENSLPLINRYIALGGIATVVPCTQGKQTLHGHHYPIETPRFVADFIKYNSRKP